MSSHSPPSTNAADVLQVLRAETMRRIADLAQQFDELVSASVGSNADDEHDPEGATIAFERTQLDSLVRQAHGQLTEIDAAQVRLDSGRYGLCETCGFPIAADRLLARPTAQACISCASAGARRPRR